MVTILSTFLRSSKLAYQVSPSWALNTFVQLLDGMIADYRNPRYEDERAMKKLMDRINAGKKKKLDSAASSDSQFETGVKDTVKLHLKKQDTMDVEPAAHGKKMVDVQNLGNLGR